MAGSCSQIVLLQQLKERGISSILADNNEHAVAIPFADKFVKVDLLNIEAVKSVAEQNKVDMVLSVCADQVLITAAKVSEDLGLPCYIDYQTACKVSDKGYMKKTFEQFDIPTSKHIFISELDQEKIANMEYPLVVKPADAYSSKGVRKATDFSELETFFEEAKKISRSGLVIVEEFNEGFELTVDFEIVDGKAILLSVSNTEKISYQDRFVAFRTRHPASVGADTIERIKKIGQKIADAFGLKNSPMLVQLISNGKRESVLEFCARTGGGAKYLLIKMMTGFDPITAVIDLTLGNKVTVDEIKPIAKHFTNEFLYSYPGEFDHLEGFEELKQEGIIKEYWQFKNKGAVIKSAVTSSDRIASITIVADSFEELVDKHNIAKTRIKIIDVNDNDIMRHDLLTDIKEL